jgi:hypothetical protein
MTSRLSNHKADFLLGKHDGAGYISAHARVPGTNIVIASAKFYINALNKVLNRAGRTHPQLGDV